MDNPKQILGKIATISIVILLILLFLSTSYGHFNFFAVARGYSMKPTFDHNELVVSIPYQIAGEFYQPQAGDILVFRAPAIPRVWCHRVVGIENGEYRTQGDNNSLPDGFTVPESDILGVVPTISGHVLSIPSVGGLVNTFNSNFKLRLGLLAVCIAALMVMEFREEKRRRKQQKPARYKRYLILAGVGVAIFMVMFLPSIPKTGYASIGYHVAEGSGMTLGGARHQIDFGIMEVGTSKTEASSVTNGGLFPVVGIFHIQDNPLDEVSVSPSPLIVAGRSQDTVSVTVDAKEIHGTQPVVLATTIVPYLLPADWIDGLSEENLWLPSILISLIPAVLFPIFVGFILGPVRFRRRKVEKKKKKFPLTQVLIPLLIVAAAGSIIALTYQQISSPAAFALSITEPGSGTLDCQPYNGIEIEAKKTDPVKSFICCNNFIANAKFNISSPLSWVEPIAPSGPTITSGGCHEFNVIYHAEEITPGPHDVPFHVVAEADGLVVTFDFIVTVTVVAP